MKQVQIEHRAWLEAMYPSQSKEFPLAGVVEESAELLHAVLKHYQLRQWGVEPRYLDVDWRAKMIDAVGDCALYMCSYCNSVGWNFELLCKASPALDESIDTRRAAAFVGWAANFAVNDTWANAYIYMSELKSIAAALRIDFEDAVRTTWKEVSQRCRNENHCQPSVNVSPGQ